MCAPWLRADTQVRPYIKYPVDCDWYDLLDYYNQFLCLIKLTAES
jgi:hypothetical protein